MDFCFGGWFKLTALGIFGYDLGVGVGAGAGGKMASDSFSSGVAGDEGTPHGWFLSGEWYAGTLLFFLS